MENKHEHNFTSWEIITGTHVLIRVCKSCHKTEHQHYKPVFSTTHVYFGGDE